MKAAALATGVLIAGYALSLSTQGRAVVVSDRDIEIAYQYMLGRWLTLRQESADLKNGFRWNEIIHHAPGEAAWANARPDVIYSEAWIYVDQTSCTILSMPEMQVRDYSVRVLNGWGEMTAEINAYRYPQFRGGKFGFCLRRPEPLPLPAGVQRVSLPNKKSRLLMSIELGSHAREAIARQKQVRLRATGAPEVEAPMELAADASRLPGVEAFDRTVAILATERDVNRNFASLQEKAVAVATAASNATQRNRIDAVIHDKAIPAFLAQIPKMGAMINGWVYPRVVGRYGDDYAMRSIAAFTGLWASNGKEALYLGDGELNGSETYLQTFSRDAPPIKKSGRGWSIAVVGGERLHDSSGMRGRYAIDKRSSLTYNADGSLTIAFAPSPPANVPKSNWVPTLAGSTYTIAYCTAGRGVEQSDVYYPPELTLQ